MGDISIMKLIESARKFAMSIDDGDFKVNEGLNKNGVNELAEILANCNATKIEDLMLDVFKPENIAKAKTDPQTALENAKKVYEVITQTLTNVQQTQYDLVFSEETYQKLSDLEDNVLASSAFCRI